MPTLEVETVWCFFAKYMRPLKPAACTLVLSWPIGVPVNVLHVARCCFAQEFVRKVKGMVDRDSDKAKSSSSDPPAEGDTLERNSSCRRCVCVPLQNALIAVFKRSASCDVAPWEPAQHLFLLEQIVWCILAHCCGLLLFVLPAASL